MGDNLLLAEDKAPQETGTLPAATPQGNPGGTPRKDVVVMVPVLGGGSRMIPLGGRS